MSLRRAVVLAAMAALPICDLSAQTLPASIDKVPPELRDVYSQNAAVINALVQTATGTGRSVSERLDAFQQLRLSYPYLVTDVAVTLTKDDNTQLALAGTQALATRVVMMNHSEPPGGNHGHTAPGDPLAAVLEALRQRLEDNRLEVRAVAAAALTSLNDQAALSKIASLYEGGRLNDQEAVRYFTLARPSAAAGYVEKVLEKGSNAAQSEALTYLAPLPDYRGKIRDQYFLNKQRTEEIRATAARVLAKSDPLFSTYALQVTQDPSAPAEVVKNIYSGVLSKNAEVFDRTQLESFENSVKRSEALRPEVDFGPLRQQLRDIKG
jgi:hypothetical protein